MQSISYDPESGKITRRKPRKTRTRPQIRGFSVFDDDQLNFNWMTSQTGPNTELHSYLRRAIGMGRDMEGDPYGSAFYTFWSTGIVGSEGYTLDCKPMEPTGDIDTRAKTIIEEAWREWKKPGNCTVTQDMPYADVQDLSERMFASAGGTLIRMVRGYNNPFGFALQLIEVDQIDLQCNRSGTANQNRIVMGKEINKRGLVVAYHLLGEHPGETYTNSFGNYRTRVPAGEFIHRYHRLRIDQQHGWPLLIAAFRDLRHLGEYTNAEVIAAQIASRAVMKFQQNPDGPPPPNDLDDSTATFDWELETGGSVEIPVGYEGEMLQPHHPQTGYGEFKKAILQGVAVGAQGMHYNQLAGDNENVNFSSFKAGNNPQKAIMAKFRRRNQQMEQDPIFEAWLDTALRLDAIGLPHDKFDKFKRHTWNHDKPPPLEPFKETRADIEALKNGLTSYRRVIAERNNTSPEMIAKEMAEDVKMLQTITGARPPWAQQGTTDADDNSTSTSAEPPS